MLNVAGAGWCRLVWSVMPPISVWPGACRHRCLNRSSDANCIGLMQVRGCPCGKPLHHLRLHTKSNTLSTKSPSAPNRNSSEPDVEETANTHIGFMALSFFGTPPIGWAYLVALIQRTRPRRCRKLRDHLQPPQKHYHTNQDAWSTSVRKRTSPMNPECHGSRNTPRPETQPRLPTLGLFLVGRVRLRTRHCRQVCGQTCPTESPSILLSEYENTQNEPIFARRILRLLSG